MYYQMIQQYVTNMSPKQLKALAESKGIYLSEDEVQKLVTLIQTEHVDIQDPSSIHAFIDKVAQTTSKTHAMFLQDLYQKYGGLLN